MLKITKGEWKNVLGRITVYSVGIYLVAETILNFLKQWFNSGLRGGSVLLQKMLINNKYSLLAGIIIIVLGMWVFDL